MEPMPRRAIRVFDFVDGCREGDDALLIPRELFADPRESEFLPVHVTRLAAAVAGHVPVRQTRRKPPANGLRVVSDLDTVRVAVRKPDDQLRRYSGVVIDEQHTFLVISAVAGQTVLVERL